MFASSRSEKGVDMPVVMLDSLVQTVLGQVVDVPVVLSVSQIRASAAVRSSLVVDSRSVRFPEDH